MALFRDDSDRTEAPTPRRREEVRDKGQVAYSNELNSALLTLVGVALLQLFAGRILTGLTDAMEQGMRFGGLLRPGPEQLLPLLGSLFAPLLPWVLGFVFTLMALAVAFGFTQAGFHLSASKLVPDLARLNPMTGLSRLFGSGGLFRLGHSLLKFAAVALVLWVVLRSRRDQLILMVYLPFQEAAAIVVATVVAVLWWTAFALTVLSLADVIYQKWSFEQQIKMTRKEVEDERKNTEGDPQIKARVRRAMRDLMRRRMTTQVPKADVVITNPTHFAVALKYARESMAAPTVVAKGSDRMALRIRELAREHRVPVVEEPPLARALFQAVEVGDEIPPRFYKAVAAVLAYVFRLPGRRAS